MLLIADVRTVRVAVVGAGVALTMACGKAPESGGAASADDSASSEGASSSEPGAPDIPWAEKTFEQRQDYMGLVVLPKMTAVFKEHEADEEVKCQTCHGEDMEQVKFEMPNALYALPAENTFQAAMEYDAEMAKFMSERVVPEMAKLLGMEPFNPETGQGFGCFGCHLKE